MRSSDKILIFGVVMVVIAATFINVIWHVYTMRHMPSEQWKPRTKSAARGREIYIANGCTYCHSQYIRPQDWGIGAERIAKSGDYFSDRPHLLGSERTGPDLSQEGGEHPDDWHLAHFINPRYTRPRSLMPRFEYLGKKDIDLLIAYVQSLGGKNADARVAMQRRFQSEMQGMEMGEDSQIRWLHSRVPPGWRIIPTESPVTSASVARGEKIYQDYCLGCHGAVGDGNGPAAEYLMSKPINFTVLRRHLVQGKYIGGILYYQIMNGVTGSAMPYFKKDLESAKIWDVGNFIEYEFINHIDDIYPSVGIPAAFEGIYAAPVTKKALPASGSLGPGVKRKIYLRQ